MPRKAFSQRIAFAIVFAASPFSSYAASAEYSLSLSEAEQLAIANSHHHYEVKTDANEAQILTYHQLIDKRDFYEKNHLLQFDNRFVYLDRCSRLRFC